MCYGEETIRYDPAAGPVVLVVGSGYATHGRFRASIEDGPGWKEFGQGDLADAIPDVFVLPIAGGSLADTFVLVVGNYAPADPTSGTQIRVVYEFRQRDAVLGTLVIEEETPGVLSCTHLVGFEAA